MRDARKVGVVLTAMALACGMQVIGARADGPHGGGGSGSGGSGGATAAAPPSPCAAPGITEVPMLGDTVSLGLPLSVDTTTNPPTPSLAGNVVVCTDIPDGSGSGSFADEAVVVPMAGEAGFGSATCAPQGAAYVGPSCAALIAVQPPSAGASGLTLDVSLPMAMCATSGCSASTLNLATAVVTGMLQCTYPAGASSSSAPTGGAICAWQGADLSVDGVPLPTPSNLSSGGLTAGGWVTPHVGVDIGFAAVLADCASDSSDPSKCNPQPDDMWLTAHAGGGRVLLLVVPDYHVAVTMPVAVASCTQLHGAGHC